MEKLKKLILPISIALVVLITGIIIITMLVGNGKNKEALTLETLQRDPSSYVEKGIKKSLSASGLGDIILPENSKATSVNAEIKPLEGNPLKLNIVTANDRLAVLANLDVNIEGFGVNGSLYVDKENFAIKSELLKYLFESDSIGVSLKDGYKNFKESGWYEYVMSYGLSGVDIKSLLDDENKLKTIMNAYSDYMKEVRSIIECCDKYEIKESTIEIDGEQIKCFEIIQTISDDTDEKMVNAIKKAFNKVIETTLESSEESPEDMDQYLDEELEESKKILEAFIKAAKCTYYISQKDGSVLKIDANLKMSMEDENINNSFVFTVDFGSNPQKVFAPNFKLEIVDNSQTFIMEGKSTIDTDSKSLKIDITAEEKFEAETTEGSKMKIGFIVDKDGKYKMTISEDDESISLDGEIAVKDDVLHITMNMKDIAGSEIEQIVLDINFNAEEPKSFEYEDLMKWDNQKVKSFIDKISSLAEIYQN